MGMDTYRRKHNDRIEQEWPLIFAKVQVGVMAILQV